MHFYLIAYVVILKVTLGEMEMSRIVSYNEIIKECSKLNIKLNEYTSKIDLARMNFNDAPKWLKWWYKMDLDDYIEIQSRLAYRYRILKSISRNYYKFVSGITRAEFKDTRKLVDLLDRLKLVEFLDMLQVQIEDNNIALKDLKVQISRACVSNGEKS